MKILIEMPTWLGDAVMATPAIENLISQLDSPEIIFIGSQVAIDLMKVHPNRQRSYLLKKSYVDLYRLSRSIGYVDLFISFRGSFRSKFLSCIIKSKEKFQFNKNKYKSIHQVEKYVKFINNIINLDLDPGHLVIYDLNRSLFEGKGIIGINPGAMYGSAKMWSIDKYSEVALSLSKKHKIIILGGEAEIEISKKIENVLILNNAKNFINLAGKTSIQDLLGIIKSLSFLITGDSGPMHIAAAYKIPTLTIFGPTKINETCQWKNDVSINFTKNLDCQPCMQRECPLGHHDCMNLISTQEVINEVEMFLTND